MGVKKKNRLKKFMQVEVVMKCMETKFGGQCFFGFGDFAPFSFNCKTTKISLLTMDYSPWGSKNRINSKSRSIETKFGGFHFFGLEILSLSFALKVAKISLLTMDYSPWGSKNKRSCK